MNTTLYRTCTNGDTMNNPPRKRGRPPVPVEERGVIKTLCLPPAVWKYIRTFDGNTDTQCVINMVEYLQRFAPLGQDQGRERDAKGRWKKSNK